MEQFLIVNADFRNTADQGRYGQADALETAAFEKALKAHSKFNTALDKAEASKGIDRTKSNIEIRHKDKGGLI